MGVKEHLTAHPQELWERIFEICDHLRAESTRRQAAEATEMIGTLTLGQGRAIKAVCCLTADKQEGVQLKEVAEYLNLSPGSTSDLVDTLVRKGALQRVICPNDRRSVRISLSPFAEHIVQVGKQSFDEHTALFVASINEQQAESLTKLLDQYHNIITSEEHHD